MNFKFLVPFSILVMMSSCSQSDDSLISLKPLKPKLFLLNQPYEMNGDADIPFLHTRRKTVNVQAFYLDSNETTGNDPRQFSNDTNFHE